MENIKCNVSNKKFFIPSLCCEEFIRKWLSRWKSLSRSMCKHWLQSLPCIQSSHTCQEKCYFSFQSETENQNQQKHDVVRTQVGKGLGARHAREGCWTCKTDAWMRRGSPGLCVVCSPSRITNTTCWPQYELIFAACIDLTFPACHN